MLLRVILPFSAAMILGGCGATYNAFDMFKKDDFYEKALVATKNGQIVNSLETKAKISATRLNGLYNGRYDDADYFFVGVYIPDDYSNSEQAGLYNKDYALAIKSKDGNYSAPLKIEEITKKEQNEIYKKMPNTDAWSRYYIVSFKQNSDDLPLLLSFKGAGGEVLLSFPKAR